MRKFPEQRSAEDRFNTHVRHYHRRGQPKRTWDEWVDGKAKSADSSLQWLRWLGIALGVLLLAAIAAGLYIEMQ